MHSDHGKIERTPDASGASRDKPFPVPPPPPPRASLPPVRGVAVVPPPKANVPAGGVGSAKGIRWKGEVESIASPPPPPPPGQAAEGPAEKVDFVRRAPPWLISTIVHLILLLALGLITTPLGEGLGNVMLTIGQADGDNDAELTEFSIEPMQAQTDLPQESIDDAVVDLDLPLQISEIVVTDPVDLLPAELGVGVNAAVNNPMFGGRSGATKEQLLKQYGGTGKTVQAVQLGLQWLIRNQTKKGSWSLRGPYSDGSPHSENEIAATSMALLALLGDGHTHLAGDYTDQVRRGLEFLVKKQARNGFMCQDVRHNDNQSYGHAQATIALCEAYAMTGDSWLRPYAQAALDYCVESQSRLGGWRYKYQSVDSDLSVTGWYVMALQSGRSAQDLEVPEEVFYHLDRFMKSVQLENGAAYSYIPNGGQSPAMNAEGLLVRQYTGWGREHDGMIRGVQNLINNDLFDIQQQDVYYWYYGTQVMHHYGQSAWARWNGRMREQLTAAQQTRGRERGSWAPQGDRYGGTAGRLYTTCLSIYCLEVYYRHLPLYDMWKEQP